VYGGIRAQYANETVAAAEFRTDEISIRAECSPQCGDLNLEVLFAYNNARPHPVEKLLLCNERAVGLQQDQKEVEGARAELDRNTVGEQPPPTQQHAETSEFDCCLGSDRTPPGCVMRYRALAQQDRLWISIRVHCSPSPWIMAALKAKQRRQ
jgi:hypothetical protein